MQYLLCAYLIGMVYMLFLVSTHMNTTQATLKEVSAMAVGQTTALGNFVTNLFAIVVVLIFWPIVLAWGTVQKLRGK